jgi:P-type E1-E2 ATPase
MGREVILCSGDNEDAVKKIAQALGIKKYYGRAFPDEKAKIIKKLRAESRKVMFVGNRVNDSPALSVADVGISIAGVFNPVMSTIINNGASVLMDINAIKPIFKEK